MKLECFQLPGHKTTSRLWKVKIYIFFFGFCPSSDCSDLDLLKLTCIFIFFLLVAIMICVYHSLEAKRGFDHLDTRSSMNGGRGHQTIKLPGTIVISLPCFLVSASSSCCPCTFKYFLLKVKVGNEKLIWKIKKVYAKIAIINTSLWS